MFDQTATSGTMNLLANQSQLVRVVKDQASDATRKTQIVSHRLSKLMKFILSHATEGIDRADIVSQYYGLEKRYCGFYTDPCLRHQAKRDFEKRFRRAQPAVSKALNRLHQKGLVILIRRDKVVKYITLTPVGNKVVQTLIIRDHDDQDQIKYFR